MKDEARDASLERALGPALRRSLRDGADECPDAETLAAWSENGLMASQRSQIEVHLASCARCQAHLAALARGDSVAAASPARDSGWLRRRWLVPAAVCAMAAALWVVMQPASRRLLAPAASPSSAAKVESPSPKEPARQLESRAGARTDAPAPSQPSLGGAGEPAPPSGTPHDRTANAARQPSAPERSGAAPSTRAKDEEKLLRQPAIVPAAPAAKQSAETADAVAMREILSSDPAVRWRIRGAQLEHTIDGGATWTNQPTGTTATLTAGASPSPDVCWLVGRRGTVLRSIDGRRWQTVPFPESVDLVQVEATGPEHATVTTVDARHFTTTDGGATWTSRGPQEF